ncbi:MAG TPA: acyl-ACP--UDP-N-acetylglucosamine O-acyltransferase [Syntrophobacteria bacterium]|nr:acyl-ACP--UDP-N-acetylglucosamine O-acyltransferase [Syntrophobacteria bacterium]
MALHPTGIIHPTAELSDDVEVGPYAIIGEEVKIGSGCRIHAHAHIAAYTTIGPRCEIYPFASIGTLPQDLKFDGRRTETIIGTDNIIREFVTINRASVGGNSTTRVGDHNFLMAYSHVAHDCKVGSNVVMANGATLGGHVTVDDHAVLGGLCAVHQFARIGTHAHIGGGSMVANDIPPYLLAVGDRARLFGLNLIGLRRRKFPNEVLKALKECYRIVFRSGMLLGPALEEAERSFDQVAEVRIFVDFIRSSRRGITRKVGTPGDE